MKDTLMAPLNAASISPHTTNLGGTHANPPGTAFLNNLKSYLHCQVNEVIIIIIIIIIIVITTFARMKHK